MEDKSEETRMHQSELNMKNIEVTIRNVEDTVRNFNFNQFQNWFKFKKFPSIGIPKGEKKTNREFSHKWWNATIYSCKKSNEPKMAK